MNLSANTFQDRMRLALDESGKTQEGLAREVDVTLRTVQFWLAGAREPKGRQLVRLATALDRHPGWFFNEPQEAAA